MHGLTQFQPLLISTFIDHAAARYADVPIVSWEGETFFRYTYGQAAMRMRRVASSLRRMGLAEGDTVGSLAWTTHRHLELMYAVPSMGIVLHAANPRLSIEHIAYSINHAGEQLLFVDSDCVELVEKLAPLLSKVDTYVVLGARGSAPAPKTGKVLFYEDLVADGSPEFEWPALDERSASTLCFTSGTTGKPKGVLYSHRGTYLSTLSIAMADAWSISSNDCIIALAPFYHCNAWGVTYLGPLAGAKLVLPGRVSDGAQLQKMIVEEGVTVGAGVPTIWMGLAEHCRQSGAKLGKLNRIVSGGAAVPLAMMRTFFKDHGVRTIQVWGMSETTHAATALWTEVDVLNGIATSAAPQGHPVIGTSLRIVDTDGKALPKDGNAIGHLQVRGNWCSSGYLNRDDIALCDAEGWLQTGDLASIRPDNGLCITDRLKDVIKSGGEWVSSIDLENAAVSHPNAQEVAVIGVPHPRWQERPVMFVVPREGSTLTEVEMQEFLTTRVAKWWLPDAIIIVDTLPHTSTGKVQKDVLRQQYAAMAPLQASN